MHRHIVKSQAMVPSELLSTTECQYKNPHGPHAASINLGRKNNVFEVERGDGSKITRNQSLYLNSEPM